MSFMLGSVVKGVIGLGRMEHKEASGPKAAEQAQKTHDLVRDTFGGGDQHGENVKLPLLGRGDKRGPLDLIRKQHGEGLLRGNLDKRSRQNENAFDGKEKPSGSRNDAYDKPQNDDTETGAEQKQPATSQKEFLNRKKLLSYVIPTTKEDFVTYEAFNALQNSSQNAANIGGKFDHAVEALIAKGGNGHFGLVPGGDESSTGSDATPLPMGSDRGRTRATKKPSSMNIPFKGATDRLDNSLRDPENGNEKFSHSSFSAKIQSGAWNTFKESQDRMAGWRTIEEVGA